MPKPKVTFQPTVNKEMQQGIHKLVALISPTLGPIPGTVAHQKHDAIELLDSGGIIARRMTELPSRRENIGAMYLRHMIWQLYEEVGDGTATAAVLFKSVYDQGLRAITAGADAGRLQKYLEQGTKEILEHLRTMTCPVSSKEQLTGIALSLCHEKLLAEILGEIVDVLGEFGRLELRKGGVDSEWTFVEGSYWAGGVLSKQFVERQPNLRTELEDVGVLITDFELEDPRDLPPVLKLAIAQGFTKLLLVAKKVSDNVVAFLTAKQLIGQIQVLPVKFASYTHAEHAVAQRDLSVLTGAQSVLAVGGQTLASVCADDFGKARLVWADQRHFGLIGGGGDVRTIREHVATLKKAFAKAEDPKTRDALQQRLGTLLSGTITLWVGGNSDREIEKNKELAQHTAKAIRTAMSKGVLPGGGAALLACRPMLCQKIQHSPVFEERRAYQILHQAMEAPIRTILANAGLEPAPILARLEQPGQGFDVLENKVVDMTEAGIVDIAEVQMSALHHAVSSAALALTVEVAVFKKNPERAVEP